jgi:hypothetical protein
MSQGHGAGRLIRIVLLTEAADPAHIGHALLEADEDATHAAFGIIRAPRIVLRLGAPFNSGCQDENR